MKEKPVEHKMEVINVKLKIKEINLDDYRKEDEDDSLKIYT